ncbi:hypothetical protein [Galbibacter sp. PAP.153]|uniref:hypothetical protein n=1 Tax=Galbibacter sp. PAP.153 TaxID=3104623 RepID=UPI0030094F45
MKGEVNYIKHLNGVFDVFAADSRLNPTHISLYMALFQLWNAARFTESFYISREEVMHLSKIGSKATYHRCIKELHHRNYVLYIPSHNPYKGSRIKMFRFETAGEQAEHQSCIHIGTGTEQALVPKDKHIQTKRNDKTIRTPEFFKNVGLKSFKEGRRQKKRMSFSDHLKTHSEKNYNDPL